MIKADQPTIFDNKAVLAAVSSKADGNFSFLKQPPQAVIQQRQEWFASIGLELEDGVCMNVRDPETWDKIREVTIADQGAGMLEGDSAIVTDAVVTNHKGVPLMLMTADCNPVIIHDPVKEVIALVHLGWQSTAVDLARKTVEYLAKTYGSSPADLKIYNGPSIRAQSYVFSPPITQMELPGWKPYLIEVEGDKYGIDLTGYNRQQFIDAGVKPDNIQVCPIDTAASPNYFSHYRAGREGTADREGRFATVCMLK